jgi:hypothetical protein
MRPSTTIEGGTLKASIAAGFLEGPKGIPGGERKIWFICRWGKHLIGDKHGSDFDPERENSWPSFPVMA